MEILHKDDKEKGSFYINKGSKIIAEISYVWASSDKIIIDHTEVSEFLKGKGIGKQLVAKTVEFAREKGIKILPLCPFAKSVIYKVKEFNDIL